MIDGAWWLYDAEGGFDRDHRLSIELHDGNVTTNDGSKGSYTIDGPTVQLKLPSFFGFRRAVHLRQRVPYGEFSPPISDQTEELLGSGTSHDYLVMRKDGPWVDIETEQHRKHSSCEMTANDPANDL